MMVKRAMVLVMRRWSESGRLEAGEPAAWKAALLAVFVFITAPLHAQSWSYWSALDGYFTPDENYPTATFMADRASLHLEGRYNYEGQDSGSFWLGYNFHRNAWRIAPILGGVVGHTKGIAPGVEVTAAWKKLDFYTEGEHLFSTGSNDEDFTYFWSELAYSPLDWLRTGIAAQRTRAFDTGVDIQRGVLIGFKVKKSTFTTTIFEPGTDNQTVVVTAAVEF
jgi:hypothetical protein